MRNLILTLCLILCACQWPGFPKPQKYEVILLDNSVIYPKGYCEWYADTNIIVRCREDENGVYWDNVYVAKEIHRITEEVK